MIVYKIENLRNNNVNKKSRKINVSLTFIDKYEETNLFLQANICTKQKGDVMK